MIYCHTAFEFPFIMGNCVYYNKEWLARDVSLVCGGVFPARRQKFPATAQKNSLLQRGKTPWKRAISTCCHQTAQKIHCPQGI